MSTSKWNDLYDRLTSRKFILTLLAVVFAIWNYHLGALSAVEFQTAVTAAVMVYVGAEAAVDVSNTKTVADEVVDKIEKRMRETNAGPTT